MRDLSEGVDVPAPDAVLFLNHATRLSVRPTDADCAERLAHLTPVGLLATWR
jgi:hypothetical protein